MTSSVSNSGRRSRILLASFGVWLRVLTLLVVGFGSCMSMAAPTTASAHLLAGPPSTSARLSQTVAVQREPARVGNQPSQVLPDTRTFTNTVKYHEASSTLVAEQSPTLPRYQHTATALQDGRVLVVGGIGESSRQGEVFDPQTDSVVSVGMMQLGRSQHTATLLTDGKVLIVGGLTGDDQTTATAELFDPATGSFTYTGSLATPRSNHSATLLDDGKVLVAGGQKVGSTYFATAELYDPVTGTFSATGSLMRDRYNMTATHLSNGKVLILGGFTRNSFGGQGFLSESELYDPATGTFSQAGTMIYRRESPSATVLTDGRILVTGGYANEPVIYTEIYNPTTQTSTAVREMPYDNRRSRHAAALLPNGKVLIAGGTNTIYPDIYDPSTDTWTSSTSSIQSTDQYMTLTRLPGGDLLAVEPGSGKGHSLIYERYHSGRNTWSAILPSFQAARHTAMALPDGSVLIVESAGSRWSGRNGNHRACQCRAVRSHHPHLGTDGQPC